jgi:CheY-like chemotaxis protein
LRKIVSATILSPRENNQMNDTVLLVEDEDNDVFFMQRAWKQAGITTPLQVAEDGRAALDRLKNALCGNHEKLPGLVLLDLKLPRIMGFEVLKWIRQQPELQTMIVIILTSSKLRSDIDTAYRLGANSYLVKPGTASKLLEIAHLIKDYWINNNQAPSEYTPQTVEFAGRD